MKILLILFFIATASGIPIRCRFNDDIVYSKIGRAYTCEVISLNLTDSSNYITDISGNHLRGKSNSDVKVVSFRNFCSDLTFVPKGISSFFANIIGLTFTSCGIDHLIGDELLEYSNLQYWSILYSKVSRIPGYFFATNQNLLFVQFGFNEIENVGEGLLDNLQSLTYANFIQNICINKFAENQSQITSLIEILRDECPDVCEFDNVEDFACDTQKEVLRLRRKVKDLEDRVSALEVVEDEVAEMREINQNLEGKFEKLEEKFNNFLKN